MTLREKKKKNQQQETDNGQKWQEMANFYWIHLVLILERVFGWETLSLFQNLTKERSTLSLTGKIFNLKIYDIFGLGQAFYTSL